MKLIYPIVLLLLLISPPCRASDNRYLSFNRLIVYDGKPLLSIDTPNSGWTITQETTALRARVKAGKISGYVKFKKYKNSSLVSEKQFSLKGNLHGKIHERGRVSDAQITLILGGKYIFRGKIDIESGRQPYEIISATGMIDGKQKSIDYSGSIAAPAAI